MQLLVLLFLVVLHHQQLLDLPMLTNFLCNHMLGWSCCISGIMLDIFWTCAEDHETTIYRFLFPSIRNNLTEKATIKSIKISLEKQLTFREVQVHLTQRTSTSQLTAPVFGSIPRDGSRKYIISSIWQGSRNRIYCNYKDNSLHTKNYILQKRNILVDLTMNYMTNCKQQALLKNIFNKSLKSYS